MISAVIFLENLMTVQVQADIYSARDLLDLPDKNSIVGYRDYTFMLFMLDTGIRPHEALQIKTTDMEPKGVWVREEVSKTRQPRFLPVSNMVLTAMRRLVKARLELSRKNNFVFGANAGKPLSVRELRGLLQTPCD